MAAEFQGSTVVVTGGSSGLGLAIAAAFMDRSANVCLIARNPERLAVAAEQLRQRQSAASGSKGRSDVVDTVSADIVNDLAVADAFREIRARHGQVDVLVNSAGISDRAAILDVTPARFQAAWELNFLAAVRCTREASADLLATRGHLVNIGSLASKVVVPYLGAYPPSKYALAAYSQQLRLELGPQGVHVLLVCPGPIRRADAGQRYDAEAVGLPEEARKPGGGADLRLLDPNQLANQIVTACVRRDPELVVPGKVRWLAALSQLWPEWGERIIRKKTMRSAT